MSGVLNDYNQQEGAPRIKIGNWVEERALMATTGQSRGSTTAQRNNTTVRITGPVLEERDYSTTSNLAHQAVLKAPHGPTYIDSIAPPRRARSRDEERLALAHAIMEQRNKEEEERKERELQHASFGARDAINRKRALVTGKPLEESKTNNDLFKSQAITFHTHHAARGTLHGVTPTDRGVHTFSKNTHFSKPIQELHESGER
jgi:hypothetical protein